MEIILDGALKGYGSHIVSCLKIESVVGKIM
jgi:hypothetical protein